MKNNIRKKIINDLIKNIPNLDSRLKNKYLKLLIKPNIYVPFILFKFFKFNYKKNINFFGKNIEVLIDSFDNYIFSKYKFLFGWWEIHLTGYLVKNLKSNDIFYDIGANTGFYSYLASFFAKEIHSFEPISDYYALLENNLKIFGTKFFINKIALADKKGFMNIYFDFGKSNFFRKKSNIVFKVKTKTLDDYLKNHNKPTILKLDTEGSEFLILKGGKNFLKNNNPKVFIEVWSADVKDFESSVKSIEFMRKIGYHSFLINDDFSIKKVNFNIPQYLKSTNQSTENILFMR